MKTKKAINQFYRDHEMTVKSIYSLPVLQRIVDHWHVGLIQEVNYFDAVGRNIWRHLIETNQGKFELYSYPTESRDYSKKKLEEFLENHYGKNYQKITHSFDRYHILRRLTIKNQVTPKQIAKDLKLLIGRSVAHAFRVYGTILQIELEGKAYVVSYASWSFQENIKGKFNVLVDSLINSKDKLDDFLEKFEASHMKIKDYVLKGGWFELYFEDNLSLYFNQYWGFPAAEIHIPERKNDINIFSEQEVYYIKEKLGKKYTS